MGKRYSEREMNRPPSQRKYVKHMRVPDGCVDIWRVNAVQVGGQTEIDSQWFDRDLCMARADSLWDKTVGKFSRHKKHVHVYVEHKAAMKIGGKFHIVNIPSFTPSDSFEKPLTETPAQGACVYIAGLPQSQQMRYWGVVPGDEQEAFREGRLFRTLQPEPQVGDNDPDSDHKQWLAEYTGSCEEADMGGSGECPAGQCCRPATCKRTDDV